MLLGLILISLIASIVCCVKAAVMCYQCKIYPGECDTVNIGLYTLAGIIFYMLGQTMSYSRRR